MKLFYHCPDCDLDWQDVCDSPGDDQCPQCARLTAPFDSEETSDDWCDEDLEDDDALGCNPCDWDDDWDDEDWGDEDCDDTGNPLDSPFY